MESELKRKIENKGMIISNIPSWAKDVIKDAAVADHTNSYGEAIACFIKEALEYRMLKEKFFNNDLNVTLSYPKPVQTNTYTKIKFANGKKLNTPEVQNE